jgi:hypothetical protein
MEGLSAGSVIKPAPFGRRSSRLESLFLTLRELTSQQIILSEGQGGEQRFEPWHTGRLFAQPQPVRPGFGFEHRGHTVVELRAQFVRSVMMVKLRILSPTGEP